MIKQFSLRGIFFGTATVALACGWIADHIAMKAELVDLRITSVRFEDRVVAVSEIMRQYPGNQGVPLLIFAVCDPDLRVAVAADHGLRSVSGMPNGFGAISGMDMDQRLGVMVRWAEWYDTSKAGAR